VLSETKTRYPHIQKLIYAIVLARRKLRHYFESHPVTVVSFSPLGEINHNREASGWIAKWVVELMGEALSFAPRKAIKSQVGNRTEKTVVDERLEHLHGYVGWTPRVHLDDDNVAGHECGGEFDYGGKPRLSPSLSRSSPFSPALSVLAMAQGWQR
jgi:hypothetical protein